MEAKEFQSWLTIYLHETFGSVKDPLNTAIYFNDLYAAVITGLSELNLTISKTLIKPHLDILVKNSYLTNTGNVYYLTIKGMLYSQMTPLLPNLIKIEIDKHIKENQAKILGVVILLILITAILSSCVTTYMTK